MLFNPSSAVSSGCFNTLGILGALVTPTQGYPNKQQPNRNHQFARELSGWCG
jgi:hypothetical protein